MLGWSSTGDGILSGRRAGGRRSDAVSYALANRMQHRSAAPRHRRRAMLAGAGCRGPVGEFALRPFCSVAQPVEVDPKAWNIWSERPVSRTSTGSSR
jgi:hypothetical protein